MAFNTFPCNPYPISTEELNKGNNDDLNTRVTELEGEVDSLKSGLTGLASNVVFEPQTAPDTSNPFGDDGSGYILKIEYNGVNLGYLVIRPKNYVDSGTSRKVALELFNSSWSKIWDVVRDNT